MQDSLLFCNSTNYVRKPSPYYKPVSTNPHRSLRLNVGFIVHEAPGYSREFEYAASELRLDDDLVITDFASNVRLQRTQRGLLIEVRASGHLSNQCVLCLDDFTQSLTSTFTELYAFDDRTTTEEELRVPDDNHIDLTPLVREYLLLDMPINPVCKPDCAGLCPTCGVNHNREQCNCQTEQIDPRFAKLKDLLEDNNED